MRRAATLLAVAAAIAGCGGSGTPGDKAIPNLNDTPSGESVVRAWTTAVYEGDYDRAADLFAPRAMIQQGITFVLTSRARALAFNRSLPCRAKVRTIERERHGVLLATFDLFPGRGGACPDGGSARVRFMIRAGKIETWHQLPDAPRAPSQST